MESENNLQTHEGLDRLKQPVLPLANMVEFLYLTGPFKRISEVLSRLSEPVDLAGAHFENPREKLLPYEIFLQELEILKGEKKLSEPLPFIVDEKQNPLPKRQALMLWIRQQILSRELEAINSILCGPCGCVLCCTGPNSEFDVLSGFQGRMKREFFEIPLEDSETGIFTLPRIDTEESRQLTAHSAAALKFGEVPFYKKEAALYHWQNGWSLILPEGSACPRLEKDTRRCMVYEKRPAVCRKPQIFPYVLENTGDNAKRSDGVLIPVFMARNMILAVWDCPYVRKHRDAIGAYAEMSGLKPIFKKSKY